MRAGPPSAAMDLAFLADVVKMVLDRCGLNAQLSPNALVRQAPLDQSCDLQFTRRQGHVARIGHGPRCRRGVPAQHLLEHPDQVAAGALSRTQPAVPAVASAKNSASVSLTPKATTLLWGDEATRSLTRPMLSSRAASRSTIWE